MPTAGVRREQTRKESMPISWLDLEASLAELMDIRDELLTEQPGLRDPQEREHALLVVEEALADYIKREVTKVDGVHKYCRYASATAAAARAEAAILLAKADRLEKQEERLKELCMTVMMAMGKLKLEGTAGRLIARQKSGGKLALQVQEDVIPDSYCDFTVTLPGDVWAQLRALLPRFWVDRVAGYLKQRKPSQERIREELGQQCGACRGAGVSVSDEINGFAPPCGECGGHGNNRVPGAQLLERGETIRIK